MQLTAIIEREEDMYVALCPEVDVASQGNSVEEARENLKEAVELFMNDTETDGIVMIGEIGGGMEAEAARWIKEKGTKPVVGFIAGQTAPAGRRMGHAGAIIGGADDTAAAKMKILAECGIHVVQSPADIGKTTAEVMKTKK